MTTAPPNSEAELAVDDILGLLAEQRRRHLLRALSEATTPISLARLAANIATLEGDTSAKRRQQLYVSLYHVDVPKLDAWDVVSYAESDGTIELGANAPAVLPYLDGLPSSDAEPVESGRQCDRAESTET